MSTESSASPVDPQVLALQDEVAQLRRQLAEQQAPPAPPREHHRARSFWSVVLITVACLLAPLSVVSVWARGEVTDTDRYVATVAPLASDPAVQSAVSARVTTEVLQYINIDSLTQEAIDTLSSNRDLTPRQVAALTTLARPVKSGIEGFIGDKVTQIIQSDAFATAWTQANAKAHDQLTALLSGDNNGAVSIEGNEVVLNVGDVVAQVKTALVDEGFTVAEKIPAVDAEIVIFQSDNVASAQRAYSALNTLGFWLPIVAVTLALIGVFVAVNSRRALIGFGIGLTVAMFVTGFAVVLMRAEYFNALPDTVNTAAATSVFDAVTYYLRQALWAGVAAGVVLILAGIMTGPSRFATGVRGLADRGAAAVQHQIASWGAGMDSVRTWVSAQATGLRIAVSLGAVVVIFIQRYKTVELVLWTTVGLLVVLFIIQILASGVEPDETDQRTAATP